MIGNARKCKEIKRNSKSMLGNAKGIKGNTTRDGGKPDFFQNPGSGSNPGFGLINPGFPVPPIFYKNVQFFSGFSNLALCVIFKTKLSSSRMQFMAYF